MISNTQYTIPNTEIILALDLDTDKRALHFVDLLYPKIKFFKIGLQLYTRYGPEIIKAIQKRKAAVFLDLKFNDIPHTVAGAVKEAAKLKVALLTIHTLAGAEALKAAAKARDTAETKLLGVTLLTSIDQGFLNELKIKRSIKEEVLYLAKMTKACGLDGVVCSVNEAKLLRKELGEDFLLVSPGIRPGGFKKDDQRRTATFKEAVLAGVDYVVIGRPILEAKDPLKATDNILKEAYAT